MPESAVALPPFTAADIAVLAAIFVCAGRAGRARARYGA
jgi:hypothetical protein